MNSPFSWTDHFLLGYTPMGDTHREFVGTVAAMIAATDEGFAACLDAFIRHAEEHFEQERVWMAETEFPAMQCHVDEHEAVLRSAYQVRDRLASHGDVATGRSLANELMNWFPGHAEYMDASLAQWMTKKRFGGKPVVLRRGVTAAE
jgi:hemerythrin